MLDHDEIKKSLCSITMSLPDGRGSGCGVFVSPKRIITAYHVVAGGKDVTFKNTDGRTTRMKPRAEGGRHFIDKGLDVAMIELAAPIAVEFVKASGNSHLAKTGYGSERKAVVATMFDGKPALHDASFNPFSQSLELIGGSAHRKQSLCVTFQCSQKAIPGWSGSPVFAEDGYRLLSLVSARQPELQAQAESLNDIFGQSMTYNGKIPFLGPDPEKFDVWVRKVELELGLRKN